MKVLVIGDDGRDKHNWGHQLFLDEIGRQCPTVYYGTGHPRYMGKKQDLSKVLGDCSEYDVIITYIMKRLKNWVRGLEKIKIPKVHIVVDYIPVAGLDVVYDSYLNQHKYSLIFARTGFELRHLRKRRKEHTEYLPYSVDTGIYKDIGLERTLDAVVMWNRGSGYPNRTHIKKRLTKLNYSDRSMKVFIGRPLHYDYVKKLQESKIGVNSLNMYGCLNQKFTETMACGAMLLTDRPKELGAQGFVPEKHLAIYKDESDFVNKLKYFLKNDDVRAEIAKNGRDFVHEYHSNKVRVREMLRVIQEVLL